MDGVFNVEWFELDRFVSFSSFMIVLFFLQSISTINLPATLTSAIEKRISLLSHDELLLLRFAAL
jgi:hypothetical protein